MFKNHLTAFKGKSDLFLSAAAAALALLSVALPITTAGNLAGPPQSAGVALATSSFEQRVLPVQRFGLDTASAAAFAISSSHSRAAIIDSLRSELKIVDSQSGALVTSHRLAESPSLVAMDDQATVAVVGYSRSNDLSIIGIEDPSLDRNVSLPSPPGRLRLASTVRKAIATLPMLNAIAVVDLRSGAQTLINVDRNPSGLDFDPATNVVLVSNYDDGTLSIISLLTHSVVASVPIGLRPADVVLDSSSGIAYVACEGSGLIERFDLVRRAPLGALNSEIISGLSRLAIFPEIPRGRVRGLLVASSIEDHSLAVFNLVKGIPWRIATIGAMSDLAPSAATGEVLALGARSEVLALDLRQISAPVLFMAEPLSPKSDDQKEFVLHGNNFVPRPDGQSGVFKVTVGDAPATSAQLLDDSTARVSWLGKLRRIPIQVETANGESNTVFLRDPDVAPDISVVTPALGPAIGGTQCTVKGDNFLDGSPGTTSVLFGLNPATDVVIVDENTITCTAPAGIDKVDVRVQNDQGGSARPGDYIYLPPDLTISDATVTEGNTGTVSAFFTVTLASPSAVTATVDYTTVNGTATGGTDYIFRSGTLTFDPGVTSQTISVPVNGDAVVEPNETFFVDLSNPVEATLLDRRGQGTIINDDGTPSLSINDASVIEGNSGTVTMTFTVSLSPASGSSVTVNYATADNTANATSGDYVAKTGGLGFLPGETTKIVTVTVNGDTLYESDETFFVNLTGATGAPVSDSPGIGTITTDDFPVLTIDDVSVTEGNTGTTNSVFTVTLTGAAGLTVNVDYATASGSAAGGSDFVSQTGNLSFSPGTTTRTITVPVNGDTIDEPDETFFVNLSNATQAIIGDNQGIGTIINDDVPPALSINDVTVTEGDTGTLNAVFTVTLSAPSGQTVTVAYTTADGTATAGSDYVSNSGTLTFSPGTTTQSIIVQIIGDTLDEPATETFFVNLSSPTNATISDSQGIGAITDDDSPPSLSIGDATLPEGNTGTTDFVFTVTLSAPSSQTVTVNYSTLGLTAVPPGDFATTSGTLTFSPGTTTQDITVAVVGDTLNELDELFSVPISSPTNATISDSVGLGTINNDDGLPTLSIGDATVTEGNAGTTNAVFTVTLSAASGQTVTINYATTNGTAQAPGDYVAATGTLTFSPGSTTQSINIAVSGDTLGESDETFFVNLASPANATISDGQGVGTITNDDGQPTLSINDISVTEGNTGTQNVVFAVTLSAASGQTVTVNYATASGTATALSDFATTGGTLTFSPGSTTQNLTVAVNGDTLNEPDETFFVNLSSAVNATISDSQGVGTINNDDGLPSLSINDVTLPEGSGRTSTFFVFTVSLSANSGQTVTVNYATADGTAIAPADYITTSGTLTFNPGTTIQNISINVDADYINEPNETFFIDLSGPTNATVSDGQGAGTIIDDDAAVSLSIGDATVTEGNTGTVNAVFTVTLSTASSQTITVNYATANGTAVAPGDYATTSGTLTFGPGSTTQNITVAVNGDALSEGNETYSVNLTSPVNATISDGQGVGTIVDDDALPSLTISDATVSEGNSGTANAVFTVTLSSNPSGLVTVNFATANGSATAGIDYVATSGTLTFGPGNTIQNIAVPIIGDTLNESDETFFVNLSNPTNAGVADGQGMGTIVNDDSAPNLSINDVTLAEGNTGTVNAVFTVTLSLASAVPVTVTYATADGTASNGSDYAATSGVLTFPPGSTIQNITVAVQGDSLLEPDETFFVNLSNPINAAIADGTGVATITNDDSAPTLTISDAIAVEGSSAVFTVSLSSPAAGAVTVAFATTDGSALADSDYVATSGTLTFPAGSTTQTINVTLLADSLSEAIESFSVNLSSPTNATIADGLGAGTILDGAGVLQFSSASYTISEGDGSATITVTRTGGQGGGVQVNYAVTNGTATTGADYNAVSGTLTFSEGETSQTFTVPIIDDSVFEGDETVNLALSDATGASLGTPSTAVLIISDNEPAPGGILQFSATGYIVNEDAGSAIITVTRTGSSTGAVSVNYATSNGTATTGSDYTSVSGTLTLAAGETSGTFTVPILDDSVVEGNETVNLALTAPSTSAGLGSPTTAVLTILNDDNPPPIISGLTPSFGSVSGGTFVRISGRHFLPGITVRFGGALCSNIQVDDENALTCSTPPGAGTVEVSVATIHGSASLPGGYTYVVLPPQGTQLDWFPPESGQESVTAAQDGIVAAAGELLPARDLSATRGTAPITVAGAVAAAPGARRLAEGSRPVSYNIYRSTDPNFNVSDESARLIANIPSGVTDYFDPDLSSLSGEVNIDPTFFYRVTAVYEQGESVQTNVATTGIAVTGVSLDTIDGEMTLVLNGVSFSTFRALIQIDGVRLQQTRFPEEFRLGNGTSSRIEGVGALNLMIAPGQTVSVVVVNPGSQADLSDAQFSPPFVFRRAP